MSINKITIFFILLIYFIPFKKVPSDFSFVQVVDLFFKIHKVFNLSFHKNINSMFAIWEKNIYGFTDIENSLNGPLIEIQNRLFPA